MKVAGIAIRTSNAAEMDATSAKIPSLWARFYQEQILAALPAKRADALALGVYSQYELDHSGPYSLLAGGEVSTLDALPGGISGIVIPSGSYLVFNSQGAMPQALIKTWTLIWDYFSNDSEYQRAYTFDFELYQAPDRVDIHIAVK